MDWLEALNRDLPSREEIDRELARRALETIDVVSRVSLAEIDTEFATRGGYTPQLLTKAVANGWHLRTADIELTRAAERRAEATIRHRVLAQNAGLPVTATDAQITTTLRRQGLVEVVLPPAYSKRRSTWLTRATANAWEREGFGCVLVPTIDGEVYP